MSNLRPELDKLVEEMREVAGFLDEDPFDETANAAAYWLARVEQILEGSPKPSMMARSSLPVPRGAPEDAAVLWVGRSESYCGPCGQTCLPDEKSHSTPCGYDLHKGCGVTYTHVASISVGEGSEMAAQKMRPDLTFIPIFNMIP